MPKLAKDLIVGDRLSLTGYPITSVAIRGGTVNVEVEGGSPKSFEFAQVVYLFAG